MYLTVGIVFIAISIFYFNYFKKNPERTPYGGKGMGILMIVGIGLIIKQFYTME